MMRVHIREATGSWVSTTISPLALTEVRTLPENLRYIRTPNNKSLKSLGETVWTGRISNYPTYEFEFTEYKNIRPWG